MHLHRCVGLLFYHYTLNKAQPHYALFHVEAVDATITAAHYQSVAYHYW